MSIASDLLDLQELDVELARANKELSALPSIVELAKKRSTYAKLKAERTKLLALRKDAEIAVSDLDEAEQAAHKAVASAQERAINTSDYRQVQDLEVELSDLAKKLDKIAFDRPAAKQALAEAQDNEAKLASYLERLESAIRADAERARTEATALKDAIARLGKKRAHLADGLPQDVLERYEKALKRFGGLAVERLEDSVPSACRTTLSTAALSDLKRAGSVAECPYCHRIIVLGDKE